MKKYNSGFTLIELSIVLVIIGLLVSSILVGKELIASSTISAQITQIRNYQASSDTFRSKYDSIPGDFPKASDFGFVGDDGNGNGILEDTEGGTSTSTIATGEVTRFWQHLSEADMSDSQYDGAQTEGEVGTTYPAAKMGRGGISVYHDSDGFNVLHIGVTDSLGGTDYTHANSLRPEEAYSIDKKMDDGFPEGGLIRAKGGTSPDGDPTEAASGLASCVNSSEDPHEYSLSESNILCQISIRMN